MVQSSITLPSNSRLVSLFRRYSRGASAIGILVGAFVLVGWLFDIPFLKSVLPGLVTMKVNTALCFILAGVALRLLENEASPPRLRHLAQALAVIVSSIGLLAFFEYFSGWDLGVDQLLIEEPLGAAGTSQPGRMAPNTAVSLVLIGFALLLLDVETSRGHSPAEFITLGVTVISSAALVGYLFSAEALYGIASYTDMALHTTVIFIVLSVGILSARPARGWMGIITGNGPGSFMARRLLPLLIGTPLVAGWVLLQGERSGLYFHEFGLALLVVGTITLFSSLACWNANVQNSKNAESLQAEAELRKSEEIQRSLFEHAPDAVLVTDQTGRIVQVNAQAEAIFGYKREELLGQSIDLLVPERLRASHVKHRAHYHSQPVTRPMAIGSDLHARRKDGSEVPVDISLSPANQDGELLVISIIRDVSERRQTEDAIRQRIQEIQSLHEIGQSIIDSVDLQVVLDSILDKALTLGAFDIGAIRLLDTAGKTLKLASSRGYRNPENIRPISADPTDPNVGMAQAEVFKRSGAHVVESISTSQGFRTFKAEGVESAIVVPVRAGAEIIGTMQFGSRSPRKFSPEVVRITEAIGNQLGIAVQKIRLFEETVHRADELTLKTLDLERANKVKDEFLAMISHELRTPLNVMMGYTGLLREGMIGELNPEQTDALKKVAIQSNDLSGIVTNLLRATQIGSGEIKAERARTDLGQLLDEIKNVYDLPMNDEPTLNWNFPSDVPIVETDSEKLRHILVNLIDNAIKFTEKGSVRITARHLPKTKTLRFTVADTGPGIPKESLPHIFDMFHQLDGSDTRLHGGLGLGLYIVKNYTELLGGEIKVKSALGRGSVFTVALPYESSPCCGAMLPAA